jgi:large subunit ribosomal protein L9
MKLILTQEVNGLGHAGDVVTVKDGFARNFLLPNNKAIAWSTGGERQIEAIRRSRQARQIRDLDHAREIKEKLESASLIVKAKVGESGHLFGSVTDKEIALAIKSSTGLDVDRHRIKMGKHIKLVGRHAGKISLHQQVVANISILVEAL